MREDFYKTRSLENPSVNLSSDNAYNYLAYPRASSGVATDRVSILGYPAVWRCLSLISGKCAKLPCDVYKEDGTIDRRHAAHWLLAKEPSELYHPQTFFKTLIQHILLHGNAFAWILRDPNGKPIELIILNPEHTGIALDNGKLTYFARLNVTDTKIILPENILHFKGLSHDGIVGYSVIDVLRESFGLGLAAMKYGNLWYSQNGAPGPFMLKFPGRMDQQQIDQIRSQWDRVHGGLDNSHRYAVIANGGSVETFKIDNDTAQFIQTREFEVACGIASIFGVPPSKLGIKINTSYGSLEQEEKSFLNDCLDDILTAIEFELEAKLLKEIEQYADSKYIQFDRRSLEQADSEKHIATLISMVNGGILTENEARAELNKQSVSGPDGDRLRMPSNLTFVDIVANPPEPEQILVDPEADNPDDEKVYDPNGITSIDTLRTATLERLNKRLTKALASAIAKRMDIDIESHVKVFIDSGLGYTDETARAYITQWIKENHD